MKEEDDLLTANFTDILDNNEEIDVDYVGFDVPDAFVVGYGLDYIEKYRNLPYVGVLKPEIYQN